MGAGARYEDVDDMINIGEGCGIGICGLSRGEDVCFEERSGECAESGVAREGSCD